MDEIKFIIFGLIKFEQCFNDISSKADFTS